jgi:hypothetical protein
MQYTIFYSSKKISHLTGAKYKSQLKNQLLSVPYYQMAWLNIYFVFLYYSILFNIRDLNPNYTNPSNSSYTFPTRIQCSYLRVLVRR